MADNPISVIVAFYADENLADKFLAKLKQMDKDATIDIMDAAVMVWDVDARKVKIKETAELTSKEGTVGGPAVGGILGIIFPPSILAIGAIGAAAGAALGHFTDQGFKNNLLKEIGENLPPGGSAIVAVAEETWVGKLSTAVEGYADLARYDLDAEASAKLTAQLER